MKTASEIIIFSNPSINVYEIKKRYDGTEKITSVHLSDEITPASHKRFFKVLTGMFCHDVQPYGDETCKITYSTEPLC